MRSCLKVIDLCVRVSTAWDCWTTHSSTKNQRHWTRCPTFSPNDAPTVCVFIVVNKLKQFNVYTKLRRKKISCY